MSNTVLHSTRSRKCLATERACTPRPKTATLPLAPTPLRVTELPSGPMTTQPQLRWTALGVTLPWICQELPALPWQRVLTPKELWQTCPATRHSRQPVSLHVLQVSGEQRYITTDKISINLLCFLIINSKNKRKCISYMKQILKFVAFYCYRSRHNWKRLYVSTVWIWWS